MARNYRRFDQDFREGAVRLVEETGKPIAHVARDLGVNAGTLSNWVPAAHKAEAGGDLSEDERQELLRLRRENAELRMQRDDAPMDVKRLVKRRRVRGCGRGRVR